MALTAANNTQDGISLAFGGIDVISVKTLLSDNLKSSSANRFLVGGELGNHKTISGEAGEAFTISKDAGNTTQNIYYSYQFVKV